MPFFEFTDNELVPIGQRTLQDQSIWERRDLQKVLRKSLRELLPEVLILAEEFCDWDDSKRRIDLLGIDRDANLVVIELKRGETGSYMELQAIRYAAMVSTMTFDQAVSAFASSDSDFDEPSARTKLLEFLSWDEPNEDDFAQDVRLVLFSEDFAKELSSSILWLNGKGLDITCFKMSCFEVAGKTLLDFQQIIPLKEAEEYQVKVREKQQKEQSSRKSKIPWNGECYANFGDHDTRSWEDARKFGFISAGGGAWYTRTLGLLSEGDRVWVNQPGVGYLGVGLVSGPATRLENFKVETDELSTPYLEVSEVRDELIAQRADPDATEVYVPIEWIASVDINSAINEKGLFGNQNSAAKPRTESWPYTIRVLKERFGVE
jgi:hypothetical protein